MRCAPWMLAWWIPLCLLACGRECGCIPGERGYESLDGPVRVELVREVYTLPSRLPGIATSFAVRVHSTPPFDEHVGCGHVDLAEDPAGKHVAFRCRGTRAWTVLHLLGGDRRVRECRAPVGEGAEPAFGSLAPLSGATARVLDDCHTSRSPSEVSADLVHAVVEEEGEAAAMALVASLAERPVFAAYQQRDAWPSALDALPPNARTQAFAHLCAALTRADAPVPVFLRAVTRCPLDVAGLGASALPQVARILAADSASSFAEQDERVLEWASLIAVKASPAQSGAIACEALGRYTPVNSASHTSIVSRRVRVAATIVAASNVQCVHVAAWLEKVACAHVLDCGDALCSAAALRPEIEHWLAATDGPLDDRGARPDPPDRSTPQLFLSAAYGQGDLPREFLVRTARRHYTQPGGGAPACEGTIPNGTPCTCTALGFDHALCDMPITETSGTFAGCGFTLDDTARRVTRVERVCLPLDGDCSNGVCCDGLRCPYEAPRRCVSVAP